MRDIKEFGLFISSRRKKLGMTQENLAMKVGITPQAVSKWENGIGYPDVTIFSAIAKALEVTVSELFGEEEDIANNVVKTYTLPEKDLVLPIVYQDSSLVCYSNKSRKTEKEEQGIVFFTDGSYVKLKERFICNKGDGDIVLLNVSDMINKQENKKHSITRILEDFDALKLSLSANCSCVIQQGQQTRAVVSGSEDFVRKFEADAQKGEMNITLSGGSGSGNKVYIYINKKHLNRLDLQLDKNVTLAMEVDVLEAVLNARGNVCVDIGECNFMEAYFNGNSTLQSKAISEKARFEIRGNASLDVHRCAEIDLSVYGNASIALKKLSGNLKLDINGNASVFAAGEVDRFVCTSDGSCDIDGKGLAVNVADVTVKQKGRIYLKQIKEVSYERLGSKGRLIAEKRGK